VRKRLGLLLLLPLIVGAKGYQVVAEGPELLPQEPAFEAGREITVAPGERVFANRIAEKPKAVLGGPVAVTLADKPFSLAAGTAMEPVLASDPAERLPEGSSVYCEAPRVDVGKVFTHTVAFGLLSGLSRTGAVTRVCLADTNGDGSAELALLAGAKRDADLKPVAIPPVPIAVTRGIPIPGHEMVIRYRGLSDGKTLKFDRAFFSDGKYGTVYHGKYSVDGGRLPRRMIIEGAAFEVIGVDKATGAARLRLLAPMPPGQYHIDQPPQYIYVYIPRH
jgi:hypothetical protein